MKTVFIATLFSVTKPFSTRALAERAIAFGIKKSFTSYMWMSDVSVFLRYFQQENYAMALEVYKKSVSEKHYSMSAYQASIVEASMDDITI